MIQIIQKLPDGFSEEKVEKKPALLAECKDGRFFDEEWFNGAFEGIDYGLTKEEIEKKKNELKLLDYKGIGLLLVPIFNVHPLIPVVFSLISDESFILLKDDHYDMITIFQIKKYN